MNGSGLSGFYKNEVFIGDTTARAKERRREDAQLRLARIANGAHPDYLGHPKHEEKYGSKTLPRVQKRKTEK